MSHDAVGHDDERPDTRWSLARERTVLGRLRLSVGLLVAGFLLAFGPLPAPAVVGTVGGAVLLLAAAGAAVAAVLDDRPGR